MTERRVLPRRRALPEWGEVLLLSALLALLSFLPYVLQSGGLLTLVADFNEQQTSFNMLANEAVKKGEWFWTWKVDLGGSFVGIFSFYNLGSPFFWLSLLFPAAAFPYLLAPLLCLKYMVAAGAAFLYLRLFVSPEAAKWGALLYAFSSFQAINLMFNHFHDVVAFFPFLLWAAEKLWEGKRGFFLLFVAQAALLNYFFFIGEVVFLLLYFCFRFLLPQPRLALTRLPRFFLEGVLGVGLAALLLLPSLRWTLGNPRLDLGFTASSALLHPKEIRFSLLKALLLPSDYMASESTIYFQGYTSIALWLPGFGLFPAFAYLRSPRRGRLAWLRPFVLFSALLAAVPFLNSIFYAFQATYYARWFYMPILLLALASAAFFEGWQEEAPLQRRKVWLVLWFSTLLFAAYCFFARPSTLAVYGRIRRPGLFLPLLLHALVSLLLGGYCFLPSRKKLRRPHLLPSWAVIWLLASALLLQSSQVFVLRHSSPRAEPQLAHHSTVVAGEVLADWAREHTEDWRGYRFAVQDERSNASLVAGLPGINSFCSTVSPSIMRFYSLIGAPRFVISRNQSSPELRAFLGARYRMSTEAIPGLQPLYQEGRRGGNVYLYEEEALPLAFAYQERLPLSTFLEQEGTMRLRLLAKALPYGNTVEEGEGLQRLATRLQDLPAREWKPSHLTAEDFHRSLQARKMQSAYDYALSTRGLRFRIDAKKRGVLLLTVPYDRDWKILIQGQEVPAEDCLGLLALPLDPGQGQVVELRYENPALRRGLHLSLLSLLLTSLYLGGSRRRKRKQKSPPPAPSHKRR